MPVTVSRSSGAQRQTPLLLLDVDGVLNALGHGAIVWGSDQWQHGWATAEGRRYPITWATEVIERLRRWHERGAVELQWLTTWGHYANDELRHLLRLPQLVVAGTYDHVAPDAGAPQDAPVDAHATVAPAAPDPLSGHWWKYDVVVRVLADYPERLVIWVDDELHGDNPYRRWAHRHPWVLPVGPDPDTGLTDVDLMLIEEAVR